MELLWNEIAYKNFNTVLGLHEIQLMIKYQVTCIKNLRKNFVQSAISIRQAIKYEKKTKNLRHKQTIAYYMEIKTIITFSTRTIIF